MKKYKILVTRTATRSSEIEVYSENEEEALNAADAISQDLDFGLYSEKDSKYDFDILDTLDVEEY